MMIFFFKNKNHFEVFLKLIKSPQSGLDLFAVSEDERSYNAQFCFNY